MQNEGALSYLWEVCEYLYQLLVVQDRTLEEHKKLLKAILKRDKKRKSKIEAAGIDYECPEIVRSFNFYYTRGLLSWVGGKSVCYMHIAFLLKESFCVAFLYCAQLCGPK